MSLREMGFFDNVEAQNTAYSYTEYTDGDGDLVVMKFIESGPPEHRRALGKSYMGLASGKVSTGVANTCISVGASR